MAGMSDKIAHVLSSSSETNMMNNEISRSPLNPNSDQAAHSPIHTTLFDSNEARTHTHSTSWTRDNSSQSLTILETNLDHQHRAQSTGSCDAFNASHEGIVTHDNDPEHHPPPHSPNSAKLSPLSHTSEPVPCPHVSTHALEPSVVTSTTSGESDDGPLPVRTVVMFVV
jgi:hypothetical protein